MLVVDRDGVTTHGWCWLAAGWGEWAVSESRDRHERSGKLHDTESNVGLTVVDCPDPGYEEVVCLGYH